MEDNSIKTIQNLRFRADKEFDYFVNTGLKIIDNLLLVNSAVIAILISSNKYILFKFPILFLILSSFSSLLVLYLQKELSRHASIKFRLAAMAGEGALENKLIKKNELPDTRILRIKSRNINWLINLSLLFFAIAFINILTVIFCNK